jgi:hypothetical protein
MEELYFIPSLKINARVSELVIQGNHIEIEGTTYQRLSRKPRGRSVSRKLLNESTNTRIIIY